MFEFGQIPYEMGKKQLQWLGGLLQRSLSNQVGQDNIVDVWQRPIRQEINDHYGDARRDDDRQRLAELAALQRCVELFAPGCADELRAMDEVAKEPPTDQDLARLFGQGRSNWSE